MTTLTSTPPRASRHVDDLAPVGVEPPGDRPPYREEPSALGPLRPVMDRWPLVLLVILVFLGGAVYAGLTRAPTYKADAEINVGRTDVRVQALPGYVAGAASLANSYSRVVTSDAMIARIAPAVDLSEAQVAANLDAVPVPENPILRVIAQGETPEAAVGLTRTATTELESYVTRTDAVGEDAQRTLRAYREQSRRAAALQTQITRLEKRQDAAEVPGTTVSPPDDAQLQRLRVAYDEAQLRATTLGQQYTERQAELASAAGIEVISAPAPAGDDRRSVLQRLVAVGLVAGVIVGSALAMLLGARGARRRRRR